MLHSDLTGGIIRAAFTVYNSIGAGFHERVYQHALEVEFDYVRIGYAREIPIKIYYRGRAVGDYFADFLVEDRVIIELKALESLERANSAQLLNYLKVSRQEVGLLLNFGPRRVDVVRMVNTPGRIQGKTNTEKAG